MTDTRPTMDQILLLCARAMSLRSSCPNAQVGVVIARDQRILSTGYNGAPSGLKHCDHPPRSVVPDQPPCVTTVHAEANAVAFAAREGINLAGAHVYTTHSPCRHCAQLFVATGVSAVTAMLPYHDTSGIDVLGSAKILFELVGIVPARILGIESIW